MTTAQELAIRLGHILNGEEAAMEAVAGLSRSEFLAKPHRVAELRLALRSLLERGP
jgi:hypothetical protein